MIRPLLCSFPLLAVALLPARGETQAGAPATPPEAPRCVDTQRIRESTVVDDWTVLLKMHGKGPDYAMRLKWRCAQLKFHETFHYELRGTTEICARMDWITSRSGSACPIERFEPVPKKTDPKSLRHVPGSGDDGK